MASKKPTVLFVDDEPIILRMFEIAFRGDFEVLTAHNGEKALEIINTNRSIGILLSDFRMPGMNGAQLITKANELIPQAKFFILTGFDFNAQINQIIEDKIVTEVFKKPADLNVIRMKFSNALM